LAAQILKIAATAEFQSKLNVEGAVPLLGGPVEYAALIKKESAQWADIVRISGATLD
jgi:tripartite-type tricarboxylate transporter receptor subunit TctC